MSYQEVTTRTDEPNSVEVTRNAKGDYQWSIKIYGNGDLKELIQQAKVADSRLKKEFLENQESSKEESEEPKPKKNSLPLEEKAPKERQPRKSKKGRLTEIARKPMHKEEEEEEELEEQDAPPPRFRRSPR